MAVAERRYFLLHLQLYAYYQYQIWILQLLSISTTVQYCRGAGVFEANGFSHQGGMFFVSENRKRFLPISDEQTLQTHSIFRDKKHILISIAHHTQTTLGPHRLKVPQNMRDYLQRLFPDLTQCSSRNFDHRLEIARSWGVTVPCRWLSQKFQFVNIFENRNI